MHALACSLIFFSQGGSKAAWPRQKAALYASVQETNRRPFRARCGGYPLWIVLDN
ncbi:hypothetical protein [Aneurinibacillus migulanus]|uniref:hypothetical protein n=1 Tax=Aneurinibacillus migulanus TaxID=47500 RepID=UPI000A4B49CA|nr:hypothetical protein [Aneurinibacillus migulanus]MCP1355253.1 hypothetical protein [Aneurinibacillus migulanus]